MTPDPAMLVHLCGVQEWSHARERGGIYPESDKTGYIHLSTLEQVHLPANRLYRGRADLVLLYIDPAALDSPVRWEPGVPTDPRSMLFPHLYGPLPVRAVIGAAAYPPAGDGSFRAGSRISVCNRRPYVGVGLDLYQQAGRNQRGNLDHARHRTDLAESLCMHFADLAPAGNIGHIDAGTDHVGQSCAGLSERNLDAAQSVSRLSGDIIAAAGRSGHHHEWPDAYRARVADG